MPEIMVRLLSLSLIYLCHMLINTCAKPQGWREEQYVIDVFVSLLCHDDHVDIFAVFSSFSVDVASELNSYPHF